MPSPFFSGRIPQELFDQVEAHRKSTGESKTDVLVKALAAYTGFESGVLSDKPLPKISEVLERLEKLESCVFGAKTKPEISEAEKRQIDLFADMEKTLESTSSQDIKLLTTQQVADAKIASQPSLSNWKKKNLLPKKFKGNIIDFSHRDEQLNTSFWKVTPV